MGIDKVKVRKKRYNPPSGYKLGLVMPEELRAVGEAYRNNRNRGKIRKSINNKGDQRYVKRQNSTRERTT